MVAFGDTSGATAVFIGEQGNEAVAARQTQAKKNGLIALVLLVGTVATYFIIKATSN